MKKIITLIFLCHGLSTFAQTGFRQYPSLNSQFKLVDLRGISGMTLDDTGRLWMSFNGFYNSIPVFIPSSLQLLTMGSDSVWNEVKIPNITYASNVQFANKALWVSTNKGLLKKSGNTWQSLIAPGENPLADTINNFLVKGQSIYMATQTGLHHYVKNPLGKDIWHKYQMNNSSLPTNKIYDVAIDAKGDFWLASNLGVIQFNPNTNQSIVYNKSNSDFFSDTVFSIKVLPNGDIWAGSIMSKGGNPYLIQFMGSPGIFKLTNGKFTNLHDLLGFCNYTFMPVTSMKRLNTLGNSILIFANAGWTNFNQYSLFETDGTNLSRTGLPIRIQNIEESSYACFGSNRILFFGYQNQHPVYELNPQLYPIDSAYQKYLEQENTKDYFYYHSSEKIDINQLTGSIYVQGDMFNNYIQRQDALSTKRDACKVIQYPAAIWMGGMNNGALHIAGGTFRQSGIDFIPGPLKMGTAEIDSLTILKYRKIWKVEKRMIDDFLENYQKPGYQIPPNILNWPAHGDSSLGFAPNLAPFIDHNNNGKYEPHLGDYPKISGDQELFWIFNDAKFPHGETEGNILGVEVHGSVYGYVCDTIGLNSENQALNHTLFFKYKIINRSNRVYTGFTAGMWASVLLGNYTDDRIGCNPKGNYAYWYNGDALDEGKGGYGNQIPACAWVALKGLGDSLSDKQALDKFMVHKSDFSVTGFPSRAQHYYNYLRGRWKDGQKVVYGQMGNDTNKVYMFSGEDDLLGRAPWYDTVTGWAQTNRSMVLGLNEIEFKPGDEKTIEFALVYTPGKTQVVKETLQDLKNDVSKVQLWYQNHSVPSCSKNPLGVLENKPTINPSAYLNIYPNPSSYVVSLKLSNNEPIHAVRVYDLSGKLIFQSAHNNITHLEVSYLENGIYMVSVESRNGLLSHGKILVQH